MVSTISVLYVDDELTLLELCKIFLERQGDLSVTTVSSAVEAIRILELKRFDAIISDYQMPEMDGIEFLKAVRARGDTTPFIIFTGKGREEVVIEALNAGADFYLQKGGEPRSQFAELTHKIRRAVEHRTDVKALTENEERFRALVENTSDVIRILDREGRIIFDTAASGRELGYPPGYTIGRYPSEFIHPDDLAVVDQELSGVYAKTNTGLPTEFRVRKADGSYVWVESVGKNLIGVPDVDGIVITTRFIDERKRAEEEISSSKAFLDRVVELSPFAMWVSDKEGTVIRVNRALCDLINLAPDVIVGRYNVFRDVNLEKQGVMPDIKAVFEKHTQARFTIPWKVADAGVIEFLAGRDMYIDVSIFPILDTHGDLTNAVCQWVDITEHKQAEESLRKSEEMYRLLSESSPDHVIVQDCDLRYLYVLNPQLGLKTEDMLGRTDYDFLAEEEADRLTRIKREVIRTGTVTKYETSLQSKGGEMEYFEGMYIPKYDKEGTIDGLIGYFRNVTERRQSEEALQESEEKFREIFNKANDAIHLHEIEDDGRPGKFIDVNDIACQMLQYSRDEMLRRGPLDFAIEYHSHSRDKIFEEMRTAGHAEFETGHRRKDGTIVPVEVKAHKITLNGRTVVLSVIRDITERKQADKRNQWLASFPELNPNPIIEMDAWDTISYANKATLKTLRDLGLPENPALFLPEDKEEILRLLREDTEHQIYREITLKNKTFAESISLNRELPAVRIYVRDITDQKKAEEALQEKEARLSLALDVGTAGIWEWHLESNEVRFDARFHAILGYEPGELPATIGEWLLYHNKEDIPLWMGKAEAYLRGDSPVYESEHRIRTKAGDWAWIFTRGRLMTRTKDSPKLFIGFAMNVTERKRVEEALRHANQKLNLLSGITRHDLKNQILSLNGYLDLSKNYLGDAAKMSEFITKEETLAKTMERQIAFTREYEAIGASAAVWQDCRSLIGTAAKEATLGLPVVKNDLPAGVEVFADPLIGRVFFNLVDNAVRYGGKITTIRFFAEERDSDHLIVCEDDGQGIPADEKVRIFERGYGKNTGMGLFLAREILSITGITITENGTPGKGARFEIAVPKGNYRNV